MLEINKFYKNPRISGSSAGTTELPLIGTKIVVKNESTVSVKYRTIISCENDGGLFAGLNITVDEQSYNGSRVVSSWQELAVGSANEIVPVVIELPEGARDEYQEKWGVLWNRGDANWEVSDVKITLTDSAKEQTELETTKCTGKGVINATNLEVK